MLYLITDDKCIYSDDIVCKEPNCAECDRYVNRQIKKVFKKFEGEQLNIFDLIDEKRKEYAEKKSGKK